MYMKTYLHLVHTTVADWLHSDNAQKALQLVRVDTDMDTDYNRSRCLSNDQIYMWLSCRS